MFGKVVVLAGHSILYLAEHLNTNSLSGEKQGILVVVCAILPILLIERGGQTGWYNTK